MSKSSYLKLHFSLVFLMSLFMFSHQELYNNLYSAKVDNVRFFLWTR